MEPVRVVTNVCHVISLNCNLIAIVALIGLRRELWPTKRRPPNKAVMTALSVVILLMEIAITLKVFALLFL